MSKKVDIYMNAREIDSTEAVSICDAGLNYDVDNM